MTKSITTNNLITITNQITTTNFIAKLYKKNSSKVIKYFGTIIILTFYPITPLSELKFYLRFGYVPNINLYLEH